MFRPARLENALEKGEFFHFERRAGKVRSDLLGQVGPHGGGHRVRARARVMWATNSRRSGGNPSPAQTASTERCNRRSRATSPPSPAATTRIGPRGGSSSLRSTLSRIGPSAVTRPRDLHRPGTADSSTSPRNFSVTCRFSARVRERLKLLPHAATELSRQARTGWDKSARCRLTGWGNSSARKSRMTRPRAVA